MEAKDFLPDAAVIAGIKADLERYEAERTVRRCGGCRCSTA